MSPHRLSCSRIFLFSLLGLLGLCLLLTGVSAILNSRRPTTSSVVDRLSDLDKARLSEAYHLRETLGGGVMPGWDQANIPQILYNERYAFLVGCPDPADGWKSYPRGILTPGKWETVPGDTFLGQPYYRVAIPDQNHTPQAFIVTVGDCTAASLMTYDYSRIWAIAEFKRSMPRPVQAVFPYGIMFKTLITGSDQYVAMILHETMHAYQATGAVNRLAEAELANSPSAAAYPWTDEKLIAAWQTELDLLTDGVRATTDAEAKDLARQFVAQRSKRRQDAGLSADLVTFERQREWEEGIAKYGEMRIYRAAAETPGYQPVPELLPDPAYHAYRNALAFWNNQVGQIRRMAGAEGDGRFYYTGMAQAVLLDRLMPGWKARLFEDGVWLDDLLAEAVN
jgi:hypothetical protein